MVVKTDIPFIGKTVKVIEAQNQAYIGIVGVITDETKNSFVVKQTSKELRVMKANTTFEVDGAIIHGDEIVKRIEDRIKSRGKK